MGSVIHRVDKTLPYVTVRPLAEIIAPKMRPWTLGVSAFTLFGAIALVLAAIGLYASISTAVTARMPEFGVRMALGAKPPEVCWLAFRRGLAITFVGLSLGSIASLLGAGSIGGLLFDVSPRDGAVFAVALSTLALVALVAALVPSLHAMHANPASCLRAE
jgi:ABC-type antimicrobial peptide transport system permease subunit